MSIQPFQGTYAEAYSRLREQQVEDKVITKVDQTMEKYSSHRNWRGVALAGLGFGVVFSAVFSPMFFKPFRDPFISWSHNVAILSPVFAISGLLIVGGPTLELVHRVKATRIGRQEPGEQSERKIAALLQAAQRAEAAAKQAKKARAQALKDIVS